MQLKCTLLFNAPQIDGLSIVGRFFKQLHLNISFIASLVYNRNLNGINWRICEYSFVTWWSHQIFITIFFFFFFIRRFDYQWIFICVRLNSIMKMNSEWNLDIARFYHPFIIYSYQFFINILIHNLLIIYLNTTTNIDISVKCQNVWNFLP